MTASCRFFETFSYLPPLDDAAISKQVDYIIRQGWIPCLEFADADHAYVKNDSTIRFGGSAPCNYYDNRRVVFLHEMHTCICGVTRPIYGGNSGSRRSQPVGCAKPLGGPCPSYCPAQASMI
jgi:hypothetical protein